MPRYAMAVDVKKCVGCSACVIVCKTENNLALGAFRDWVVQETTGTYPHLFQEIRSERCNHCSDAPCVRVCPTGASFVHEGGIVLVDHHKCTGCKACIAACPYDARYITHEGYVDKCTFCAHRIQEGKTTACAENCPTMALTFGDLHDSGSELHQKVTSRKHKVLKSEQGAQPHLFFLL